MSRTVIYTERVGPASMTRKLANSIEDMLARHNVATTLRGGKGRLHEFLPAVQDMIDKNILIVRKKPEWVVAKIDIQPHTTTDDCVAAYSAILSMDG